MGFELCSPSLIDTVIGEVFDRPLREAGFEKIRHRVFVRSRFAEMNDVIEFYRDHLNLNFVWGFSLNFVPHLTQGVGEVRWHRTVKSARMDLRYSGFGRKPAPGWCIETTQGEARLRSSALLTCSAMLPKATALFESVHGFQDLSGLFRAEERPNDWGWSLTMFPQVHLAYAFYLAKSGQEAEAREMMSDWMARNLKIYREEALTKISRLFDEALRLS
jgi:hypothetical protein